jgi:hypothetical protein
MAENPVRARCKNKEHFEKNSFVSRRESIQNSIL